MGKSRPSLQDKYGKKDDISDYTDEQLADYTNDQELLDIQTKRLNKKLESTAKTLEDEIKKQTEASKEELTQATNLDPLALQRKKRMDTLGRAGTVKPIVSPLGAAYSNPSSKTLIGY